jgi:ribosomal protein S18 acetylase RimI-like enzyme
MEFEVVPYRPLDFTRVCMLERKKEECGYPAAVFVRQMEELAPSTFFVARSGGNVIGFAVGAISGNGNRDAWVLRLRVLPGYQRKGIGSALMSRLIRALASTGAGQVFLSVSPENVAARRLYEKLGFSTARNIENYFGPGEDRLILCREIQGPESD